MKYRGGPRTHGKYYKYFYPGTAFFVIFWFPIVVPLLINLIASVTELAVQLPSNDSPGDSVIWNTNFLVLLFKNSYLAFISTDLWVLTTTLVYSAKGSLEGWRSWVYGYAAVIAIFVHLLFYVVTVLAGSYESDLWLSCFLFVAGCVSVFWLRYVIYQSIENAIDWREVKEAER